MNGIETKFTKQELILASVPYNFPFFVTLEIIRFHYSITDLSLGLAASAFATKRNAFLGYNLELKDLWQSFDYKCCVHILILFTCVSII